MTIVLIMYSILYKIIYRNIFIFNIGIYGASKCLLLHLIQLECLKKNIEDVVCSY